MAAAHIPIPRPEAEVEEAYIPSAALHGGSVPSDSGPAWGHPNGGHRGNGQPHRQGHGQIQERQWPCRRMRLRP